jgi:hypothetical protein
VDLNTVELEKRAMSGLVGTLKRAERAKRVLQDEGALRFHQVSNAGFASDEVKRMFQLSV